EEIANARSRQQALQRRLDVMLIDIERTDAIPLRGIGTEIGGRRRGALALDGVEPLAIERQRRVMAGREIDEEARQAAGAGLLRQAIEHPIPLAPAVKQASIAEQLQVTRHAGLALAEDVGELADRQLT